MEARLRHDKDKEHVWAVVVDGRKVLYETPRLKVTPRVGRTVESLAKKVNAWCDENNVPRLVK